MHFWMVLGLAVPLAFGQSTGAGAAAEPRKIRLEGSVLSTTGEPVRKANVRLQAAGGSAASYTESSGNDGKFLFDDVPAGRYILTAEKAGFVTGRYGARTPTAPATPLNVAAGQEMKDLVFLLTPHGVLSGKVLDQDGDPLERAQVEVMRQGYKQGRRELLAAGGTSTDDQGSFRVANLVPGRYFLSAQDRDSLSFGREERPGRAGAGSEGYALTYYPGVVDVASASGIDVTAGAEQAGILIQLRKSRVFAIRGRAVDTATAAPPWNVQIMALPKEMSGASVNMLLGRSLQQVRPDGSFEIRNLSPGAYVLQNLTSFSSGGGAAPVTGRLEVTVADADVNGVTLVLGPGAEINGRMSLEGSGRMVSGARPKIELMPADGITLGTPNAQIGDDGSFQIKGVPASKFVVNVGAVPEGMYVKAVRFNNVDVVKEVLDLTSGAGGMLAVVLASSAADVSGMLRDGKGEAMGGISVTLWPKDFTALSPWIRVRSAVTDQSGSFKFTGLAPGDYYVAAWDDAEPGLLQNAGFLAGFIDDAVAVRLEESSHETANLKLITRDKIEAGVAKVQ